jgi:hypothetical protein
MRKNKAYLFGPFFGELSWEFYRFAPYAIHLKKENPDIKMIVMTRSERFDLYGQYADILVPLKIENENVYRQQAFKLLGFDLAVHKRICDMFRITYKKKYIIEGVFVPDVSSLRYNLKWQFPRGKMTYDFFPRKGCLKLIRKFDIKKYNVLVDFNYSFENHKYNIIEMNHFHRIISTLVANDVSVSYIGCLIEMIKHSKFVISNLNSDVGKLSLLLKVPLIYPNRKMSTDNINLLNPLNTPIIDCENVIEGVRIYENNI